MKFFDILKALYQKDKVNIDANYNLIIGLNKYLSYDKDNLPILKKYLNYMFNISAQSYFYLLYISIPKKVMPYFKKIPKQKSKTTNKLNYIQKALDLTNKEINLYKPILNAIS